METKKRVDIFVKRFGFDPNACEVCPRFERCSVNKCPLHPKYDKLESVVEDKEKTCKLPKIIRKQIGIYFKLKNNGLKPREISAMKKWEEMPENEKQERISKLKKNSPVVRLKSKGYAMVRVKPIQTSITHTNNPKPPLNCTYGANSNDQYSQKTKKEGDPVNNANPLNSYPLNSVHITSQDDLGKFIISKSPEVREIAPLFVQELNEVEKNANN